jgi:toxin HigB-1
LISAIWDEGFKRSYRKRIKKNEQLKRRFWQRMELFLAVPFSPQLRTHKLSGKLEGQWAFSVDDDCRIIFEFIGEDKVLLIDIGSHDEVY